MTDQTTEQTEQTEQIPQSKQPVVLYHGGCSDGFCAAWVFHARYPNATFLPVRYGEEPPVEAFDISRPLYIVDFSYPADVLIKLATNRKTLLVILDHHKTAQEALSDIGPKLSAVGCDTVYIFFDMNKSGGRLAWEYLHGPGKAVPLLVQYTEDRDLWRHALHLTKEVNAGLRTYPMTFDAWNMIFNTPVSDIVLAGEAVLRAEEQTINSFVSKAHPVMIGGIEVKAVNTTTLISEIAGALAKGAPFGATYFDTGNGLRIWSLRSDRDGANTDVSAIAMLYGGGGHRNAAGFQQPVPPVFHVPLPVPQQ